jgi:GH15 family glucan-1,4-alpha-glucosidase
MASRIEDYGLIGNTRTAALVSRSGSIDWLCTPRFDSDACFAALLGYDEHGRWSLRPTVPVRETRQRYRDDTLILETEFHCDGGAVRVLDFMPIGTDDRTDVVRVLEGLEGEVTIEMIMDIRFGYGAETPSLQRLPDGVSFTSGPNSMMFRGLTDVQPTGPRLSAYVNRQAGPARAADADLVPVAPPQPAAAGPRAGAGRHRSPLA